MTILYLLESFGDCDCAFSWFSDRNCVELKKRKNPLA